MANKNNAVIYIINDNIEKGSCNNIKYVYRRSSKHLKYPIYLPFIIWVYMCICAYKQGG